MSACRSSSPPSARQAPDCLVVVDAVHHAPHGVLDVRASGVDLLVFSGYKVFGPMLGVLWGRAEVLERLRPYRVETNKDVLPGKFEMGMLNNASVAALGAALEYLLWVADLLAGPQAAFPDRASKFRFGHDLDRRIRKGDHPPRPRGLRDAWTCPASAFSASPIRPAPASASRPSPSTSGASRRRRRSAGFGPEAGIQIADGNHYSAAVVRHLGRPEGICRASFAHYDNVGDGRPVPRRPWPGSKKIEERAGKT